MKKILITAMALSIMFSFAGCAKKDNSSADSAVDTSSNGGGFELNIETPELNLDDIEIYDDIPENTINFSIESFKLESIDNFEVEDYNRLDDFSAEKLQEIETTKKDLLNKLTVAFSNAGINVDINETSGEISLDSSVLFGGDSAELSDAGKEFLNKFITTYTSVVFSEEFDGFISKILVEGHTAPVSGDTYEDGLPLSQERADNVKDYCISSKTGVSDDFVGDLAATLKAVGLSNSKPVKDADGNVDMAASRRVSFRFLINLDA